jgi:hypothetical protein
LPPLSVGRIYEFREPLRRYQRTRRPEWAVIPLFSGSLRRRWSRIPALEEHSVADNFLQKQQKQRDAVEERPITDAFFAETRLDLGLP